MWILVAVCAVLLTIAVLSILETHRTRAEIRTGRPRFDAVASVTGQWNRAALDRFLGPRDADDRYTASNDDVARIPRTTWARLTGTTSADYAIASACVAAPFCHLILHPTLGWLLVGSAGTFVLVEVVVGVVILVKNDAWNRESGTRTVAREGNRSSSSPAS